MPGNSAKRQLYVRSFDEIAEVDVNPLAVMAEGNGCSALDCAIIPQRPTK